MPLSKIQKQRTLVNRTPSIGRSSMHCRRMAEAGNSPAPGMHRSLIHGSNLTDVINYNWWSSFTVNTNGIAFFFAQMVKYVRAVRAQLLQLGGNGTVNGRGRARLVGLVQEPHSGLYPTACISIVELIDSTGVVISNLNYFRRLSILEDPPCVLQV